IDDGTGTVLVSPQRAEQIMKMSFYFETGLGKVLPTSLIDFMEANHIGYKSFLGNYRLRFKEWRIHENDAVYVLGTAANISQEDYFNRRKEKLVSRIASLKNNPQAMAQVDSNQDGTISVSEWNAAVSRIEEDLLQEEINQMSLEEQSQLIIHKGDKNEVFIISDCSQKDLVSRLSWQALGGVFGGALLALGMLGYLLMRFNF
ncbi:MAG TPA: hypothetical protein PKH98_01120, partial [Candidatus Omnitrophota bacterium]|nr:hypothetical protein [Candidatus Omnitrophota bacterium]